MLERMYTHTRRDASVAARDLAARRTGVLGLCFPDLDAEDGVASFLYD